MDWGTCFNESDGLNEARDACLEESRRSGDRFCETHRRKKGGLMPTQYQIVGAILASIIGGFCNVVGSKPTKKILSQILSDPDFWQTIEDLERRSGRFKTGG